MSKLPRLLNSPVFRRNLALLALAGVVDILAGCAAPFAGPAAPSFSRQRPTSPPQPPALAQAISIDIRDLIELRKQIPEAPEPPEVASPVRVRESVHLERIPRLMRDWWGTPRPLIQPGNDRFRVAVIVEQLEHRKYLADAMLRALQELNVELVDRQYEEWVRKEKDAIAGEQKGETEIEDVEDSRGRMRGRAPADYVIYIHVGVDRAENVYEALPIEIRPSDWEDYLAEKAKFLEDRVAYDAAIEAYNAERSRLLRQTENDIRTNYEPQRIDYEKRFRLYEQALRRYNDAVAEYNLAVDRYEEEYAEYSGEFDRAVAQYKATHKRAPNAIKVKATPVSRIPSERGATMSNLWYKYICPDEVSIQVESSRSLFELPPNQECDEYELDEFVSNPKVSDERIELYENRWEALPAEQELYVRFTRFQFGLSARVVDLVKGENVWFGFAEAQDTEFVRAVIRCCRQIAHHLVVGENTD